MATLVLGAVGSAIGGAFGGAILGFSGAAIGGFIGSTIGSVVDNWIVSSLAPAQRIEGARLDSLRITASTEGAVIPRLFGRMRIGGNIIWATDFREEINTTRQGGGKGSKPKVTTTEYLYYATVTFANAVTQVGMPQANLTAQLLGLGGATADATNRLSVNTPNVLLNNGGASIDVTVNKNAAANDASFSFKTGFSVRALFGTLGSDDFALKVSPNGSSFFDALVADRNTGRVRFPVGVALTGLAADPSSPADGWLWHNSTTGQLRSRLNGITRILADQDVPWISPAAGDYALTTSGAGGAATGVLAGAAGRIDLFPFIPRDDITVDRLSVNVTTFIAAALGKIVIYATDATGRPAALILETGDLDFSTVGLKEATVAQTLRRGITYWIGIRHSSTAILSAWASTATPDLNGGAPVITARKVLRRTLAYATAAPGTWGYVASETNAGPGTAIWLRAA